MKPCQSSTDQKKKQEYKLKERKKKNYRKSNNIKRDQIIEIECRNQRINAKKKRNRQFMKNYDKFKLKGNKKKKNLRK